MFYPTDNKVFHDIYDPEVSGIYRETYDSMQDKIVEEFITNKIRENTRLCVSAFGINSKAYIEIYNQLMFLKKYYEKILEGITTLTIEDKFRLTYVSMLSENDPEVIRVCKRYEEGIRERSRGVYFHDKCEIWLDPNKMVSMEELKNRNHLNYRLLGSAGFTLLHEFAHHVYRTQLSNYTKEEIFKVYKSFPSYNQRYLGGSEEYFCDMFASIRFGHPNRFTLAERELIKAVKNSSTFIMYIYEDWSVS